MEGQVVEAARRWPADQGVSQVHDGWVSDEKPDVLLTAGQVAHSWAGDVFAEDLEPAAALALLDRLDLPPNTQHRAELRQVLAAGTRPLPQPRCWIDAKRSVSR